MVALRWALKLIGLVNTTILARLLTPEDFGLIAMSSMVVGFIEIWFAFGVDMALIQNKAPSREDYDTAWTLRIAQGLLVGVILLVVSPEAAVYFHEPRIIELLWVMVFCTLLGSTNNIGVVDFRKGLNFKAEFAFNVACRLLGFIATIALAFWLRNYWAMIGGIAINSLLSWLLSYVMHPFRPRLSLTRIASLWNFSKWMLVANTGIYINMRLDEFVAARLGSSANFGIYNVSSELGQLPTNELSIPVSRVLVPVLSKIQDEKSRVWETYLKTMAGINTLTLPAGIGMALVTPDLVPILLGEHWLGAIPYIRIFALYGTLRFVFSGIYNVFTAQGKIRAHAAMLWFEIMLVAGLCFPAGAHYGLLGIAMARLAVSGLIALVILVLLYVYGKITPFAFFGKLLRPGLASLCMAMSLWLIPHLVTNESLTNLPLREILEILRILQQPPPMLLETHALNFAALVTLGTLSYTSSLLILWRFQGKPDGVESIVLSFLVKALARRNWN